MDIIINYWAVIGGAIFLFVMGMLWYGPLFGKTWMKIVGAPQMSKEEMARLQKEMMPYYGIQFIFTLITSYVLYAFVQMSGMGVAFGFWIWLGFAVPMAGGAMWDTKKGLQMTKFLVSAGFQLVTLLVLSWVFTNF
ncbi:MAG: DUF1761 domain-containing protein [Candidatus Paceibacterota bacterium]